MTKAKTFRLLVLRHGNTFEANQIATQVGSKTDMSLTEKGLNQAKQFLALLKKDQLSPFAIYSGSLQRQSTTAKLIQEAFPQAGLYTHQDALDEIDYGAWEGLTTEEIKAKWPNEYEHWVSQATWPNKIFQSSLEKHQQALQTWLEHIASNVPENGLVVAVSSNGIIRFMLQWIPTLWNNLVSEQKIETYKVGTGCYCDLRFKGLVPEIAGWNLKP
ncbi:MAG: histidine phosphatase family protein [Proteobacteria bacterium]|nr:histidine phosphatase family protein [Pseudomonadota bacterium]